jgi:hypothetical protein
MIFDVLVNVGALPNAVSGRAVHFAGCSGYGHNIMIS